LSQAFHQTFVVHPNFEAQNVLMVLIHKP